MEVTLLLGATGVDKRSVVGQLSQYRREVDADSPDLPFLDLERDFVAKQYEGQMFHYLDDNEPSQRGSWRTAWDELITQLREMEDDHDRVLVGLHGTLVRDLYGVRSPIDISRISTLQPKRIVTLIDDVYSMWARTEERAREGEYIGQPTLSQLLDARRTELLLGDLIAAHVGSVTPPRNWLLAAKSPARQLHRLIELDASDLRSIYVSFPISGPRRALERGNPDALSEINAFLKTVADQERNADNAVVFNPLAIDELPMLQARPEVDDGTDHFEFRPADRWDIREFWPDDILLSTNPADVINVRTQQVNEADGSIRADIRVRDYRLVNQSKNVLAFNPLFENKEASGVANEIAYGVLQKRPVHVYQSPDHDQKHQVDALLRGSEGTLGGRPSAAPYVKVHDSAADALAAVLPANSNGGDDVV